MSKMKDSVT